MNTKHEAHFNSTMVRLKVVNVDFSDTENWFQFHYGTIKR